MTPLEARRALAALCGRPGHAPVAQVPIGAARVALLAAPGDPRALVAARGLRARPFPTEPVGATGGPTDCVHVGAVDDDDLRAWSAPLGDGPVRRIVDARSGLLGVWDREERLGFWGVRDAGTPSWDVGAPMRPVLSWILEPLGALVHAAVVVGATGAVLVAGPGGSGKSTTALHAVLQGYGTLGDDYCLVDPGSRVADRIFSTAKVRDAERPALEALVGPAFGRCEPPDDRTIHLLPHALDRARLTAVVLPRLDGPRDAVLRPCSGGQALRVLAPSSIAQVPVEPAPMMRRIAELLRSLPAHTLDLAPDRTANIAALATLLGPPPTVTP